MSQDYEKKKQQAVKALAEINQFQPLGTELFNAIARVSITVALEAVCLRQNPEEGGRIEVLLIKRKPDDTAYPNEWHCPGSAKRLGESDEDVIARLSKNEFRAKILSYKFVGNCDIPNEARGHFFDPVYLCQVEQGPEFKGTWFPVNGLPEKTVDHHRDRIIPMAAEVFKKLKQPPVIY